MFQDDVQLIRKTLLGDDSAFAALVEKYQKDVHGLIWRKIGDFHHAEEITQDTFLQAYKKLGTLRDPKSFAGWLYVIANRLSINWIQRSKPKTTMQSLEDTSIVEIEESDYIHHTLNQREAEAEEHCSEVVKKLLERLPESERTVVTLHFLSEMTTKEIGNFLGVSVNTIKSRLRRGRERLQGAESLVREVLGSVQLSPDLTERIMRQVAEINPLMPPAGKPMVPWMALGAAAVFVLLMLGVGNQYLARFQRPYSFEARSEPTIEIVEAPIVIDILSKPTLRKQFGRSAAPGKSIGAGTQISETTLRSNAQEDRRKFSTAQWTPSNTPPGGHVRDVFATPEGTVYTVSSTGMYRLPAEATQWTRVNLNVPIGESEAPMVENQGVLYVLSANEIFASTDKGETWNAFCPRPKGDPIGLIIMDGPRVPDITMYLALRDEGVFRSTNSGTHWKPINEGLADKRISAVTAVENTLFAGTSRGLHRLDSETWRKVSVGTSNTVYSLAVLERSLYVGTGPDLFESTPDIGQMVWNNQPNSARIFRSKDLGASWTEITPENQSRWAGLPSGITILTAGKTLLALGATQSRSTDGGETWTDLGVDTDAFMLNSIPSVAVNERTFYKVGAFGVHRTTDGGESWHLFMGEMAGTRIKDIVSFNSRLYASTGDEIFQSINGGRTWKGVRVGDEQEPPELIAKEPSGIHPSFHSKLVITGDALYSISPIRSDLRIFRLSTDGNILNPVRNVPDLDGALSLGLPTDSEKAKQTHLSEITVLPTERRVKTKTLTANRDVFYLEYKRSLFKWRLGDTEWTSAGLVDSGIEQSEDFYKGFSIAVSGEIVYVGKREGELLQSLDAGSNWRDITPNLPLHFAHFKEIVFSGSTLYVATDKGVLVSETGEYWRVITDSADMRIVINKFAIDGTEVYGIADTGVYRLDTHTQWEQIASEVPEGVDALAITNGRLYGAVTERGIFNMSLENVGSRANAQR